MRWRGVTFDNKVTWCTVRGAVETLISFDPAILLLERLPHRYANVQKKRLKDEQRSTLWKLKKVETT